MAAATGQHSPSARRKSAEPSFASSAGVAAAESFSASRDHACIFAICVGVCRGGVYASAASAAMAMVRTASGISGILALCADPVIYLPLAPPAVPTCTRLRARAAKERD